MSGMTRTWFKRGGSDTSLPTSPQSPIFGRRRAQTEGAADNGLGREESNKTWARLTARLRSLGPVTPQCETQYHYNQFAPRSQTPPAEMLRRQQLEDTQKERENHPFLAKHKNLSRAASTQSRHSGLRPPPRRMSSQSSRTDFECASASISEVSHYASSGQMTVDVSSAQSSYSKGHSPMTPHYSPLPTPPSSVNPNTFSPPERIRRSWSGHPFAARPRGYTPESSETSTDDGPFDMGKLFSVPETQRTPAEHSLGPPSDHPFAAALNARKQRQRRGTFGSNNMPAQHESEDEYEVWR